MLIRRRRTKAAPHRHDPVRGFLMENLRLRLPQRVTMTSTVFHQDGPAFAALPRADHREVVKVGRQATDVPQAPPGSQLVVKVGTERRAGVAERWPIRGYLLRMLGTGIGLAPGEGVCPGEAGVEPGRGAGRVLQQPQRG